MPSLLDIAPPELSAETVDIRGTTLTVCGIAADGWATLYSRFPVLRAIMAGRSIEGAALDVLRAQSALIAAGTGAPGNADVERAAMVNLTEDDQKMLVETIRRLSLPGHVYGPLLDGAAEDGAAAGPGKAAATK